MKQIAMAVYSKFSATTGGVHNSLYTAVDGQLYDTTALQTATFPYIVYTFVTQSPEHTFSDEFENVVIQFSIFSDKESALEVEDIRDKLWALYDWCALTVTGYTHLYMRRLNSRRVKDDRPVWQHITEYRIFIHKS